MSELQPPSKVFTYTTIVPTRGRPIAIKLGTSFVAWEPTKRQQQPHERCIQAKHAKSSVTAGGTLMAPGAGMGQPATQKRTSSDAIQGDVISSTIRARKHSSGARWLVLPSLTGTQALT